MGMVNAVVPHADLERTALDWGRRIVAKSPTAQRMLKYSFNLIDDGLVGQQLFAGETTRLAYMAEEAVEGRDAFLEKRDRRTSPASPGTSEGLSVQKVPTERREDAVIVEVIGGADERPEARVVDVDDLGRVRLALGEVTDEEAARGPRARRPRPAARRLDGVPGRRRRCGRPPNRGPTGEDWTRRWDEMIAAARADGPALGRRRQPARCPSRAPPGPEPSPRVIGGSDSSGHDVCCAQDDEVPRTDDRHPGAAAERRAVRATAEGRRRHPGRGRLEPAQQRPDRRPGARGQGRHLPPVALDARARARGGRRGSTSSRVPEDTGSLRGDLLALLRALDRAAGPAGARGGRDRRRGPLRRRPARRASTWPWCSRSTAAVTELGQRALEREEVLDAGAAAAARVGARGLLVAALHRHRRRRDGASTGSRGVVDDVLLPAAGWRRRCRGARVGLIGSGDRGRPRHARIAAVGIDSPAVEVGEHPVDERDRGADVVVALGRPAAWSRGRRRPTDRGHPDRRRHLGEHRPAGARRVVGRSPEAVGQLRRRAGRPTPRAGSARRPAAPACASSTSIIRRCAGLGRRAGVALDRAARGAGAVPSSVASRRARSRTAAAGPSTHCAAVGEEELFLAGEVVEDRLHGHAGRRGDVDDRHGVEAVAGRTASCPRRRSPRGRAPSRACGVVVAGGSLRSLTATE